jgi:hypothetical protein
MPRLIINAVAPAAGCETLNMSIRTVASSSDTPIAPARAPLTSATPACWCISPKAARAPAPPATPQACPPMALRGAAEGASGMEKIKKALAPIGGYTKGSPVARPTRASKVTATAPANRAVRRAGVALSRQTPRLTSTPARRRPTGRTDVLQVFPHRSSLDSSRS